MFKGQVTMTLRFTLARDSVKCECPNNGEVSYLMAPDTGNILALPGAPEQLIAAFNHPQAPILDDDTGCDCDQKEVPADAEIDQRDLIINNIEKIREDLGELEGQVKEMNLEEL